VNLAGSLLYLSPLQIALFSVFAYEACISQEKQNAIGITYSMIA
jgi:hypothetical protein